MSAPVWTFSRRRVTVALAAAALLASGTPVWAAAPTAPVDRLRVIVETAEPPPSLLDRLAATFLQLRLRAVGPVLPKPGTRFRVTAVAYSSTVAQTDLTPCITAAGTRVRDGIIATNFLPLGTQLKIEDDLFVVEDRMNARYNGKYVIDIWHPTTEQARTFGAQIVDIEIIGWSKLVPAERQGLRRDERAPLARVLNFLFGRAFITEEEDCL